jgi:hypothetical protein
MREECACRATLFCRGAWALAAKQLRYQVDANEVRFSAKNGLKEGLVRAEM